MTEQETVSYEDLKNELNDKEEEENVYKKVGRISLFLKKEKTFKRKSIAKSKKRRKTEEEEILKEMFEKTLDFKDFKGTKFEEIIVKVEHSSWEIFSLKTQ
jgi:chaperonin cofactor prefoldin